MPLLLEPMSLDLSLPWQLDEQREKTFKNTLKGVLIPLLLLFVIVPFLPRIHSDYTAQPPTTRTQVLLAPVIEPEPVIAEPEPVVIEPEPQPPTPVAQAQPPTSAPRPQPKKKPVAKVDTRQSMAEMQGLSELSSQLNAVRSSVNMASLRNKNLTDDAGGNAAQTTRTRLGQDLASRSSGTVVNETVMAGEVTQLADHQSAAVEGLTMNGAPAVHQSAYSSDQTGRRDMESIRRTLEQAKGSVYALYQRALLEHPGLTGEFTFELVIEPNGSISKLTLLVSELHLSELEKSILDRIRAVNFGVMDVPPTVVEYRFVFLPS